MNIKEFFATLGIQVDGAGWQTANDVLGAVSHGLDVLRAGAEIASQAWDALISNQIQHATEISKLAQIMGVSTDEAQRWSYALSQAGVSTDDFIQLAAEIGENIGEAAGGTGEAADAFQTLGIKTKDAQGKLRPIPEVLADIADKMSTMNDGTAKTGAVTGLFGEEGIKLLPILNKGSAEIRRLGEEAEELGLILEQDTLDASIELGQQWNVLKNTLSTLGAALAGPLVAALSEVATAVLDWYRANQLLIKQRLDKAMAILVTIGKLLLAVLRPLWMIFRALVGVLTFVVDYFEYLAVLLGGVLLAALVANASALATTVAWYIAAGVAAVAAGLKAAAVWTLANLPLIAMAALFALLILVAEDLYTWWMDGDSLIGSLWGNWSGFLDEFTTPREGDPWWLAMLREAVQLARDLVAWLEAAYTWSKTVAESISSWLGKQLGEGVDLLVQQASDDPRMQSILKAQFFQQASDHLQSAGLGGAAGQGLAGMTSANTQLAQQQYLQTFAPTTTLNVTVNGGDPKEVEDKIRKVVKEENETMLQEAKGARP